MLALTLNDWKDLAETADHLVVALAVLIGGGWTLYTFHRLRLVANAMLELKAKEKTIEEKEKALHESAVLEATISAHQIFVGEETNFYISAIASVVNIGNVDTLIRGSEVHFIISEATFDENSNLNYEIISNAQYPNPLKTNWLGTTVPPRYTTRFDAVFKVKKVGLFLITFRAKAYGEDSPQLVALAGESKGGTYCIAHSFVCCKRGP
jgi:hypothetical protein